MKRKKSEKVYFWLDDSLKSYDGSMLELHTRVTMDEWRDIVRGTVRYKAFTECVKEVAPLINEKWERRDQVILNELNKSVARMRNIDALLVSSCREEELKTKYMEKAKAGATNFNELVANLNPAKQPPSDTLEIEYL